MRVDTTVVGANVAYPTDAGLLTRAIGKLQRTIQRIQAAGGARRTRARDRRRAARRRAHQLAKTLRCRSEQAKDAVLRTIGELSSLAEQAITDAARVARNARRTLARADTSTSGWLGHLVSDLDTTIQRTTRIVAQTGMRLAGQIPEGPAGWSACTTPTPDRSARAGWAGRSSSATRPRSSTTPTGSCSTIRSWSATRQMRRCWPRRPAGHRPHR